jgi:hypothetical protein
MKLGGGERLWDGDDWEYRDGEGEAREVEDLYPSGSSCITISDNRQKPYTKKITYLAYPS